MSIKPDYTPILVEVGIISVALIIFVAVVFIFQDKEQSATKSAPVMDGKEYKLFVLQSKPESVKK